MGRFEGQTPCPRCGYDLRASSSDRCPECGEPIDREKLAESGFPWAHRKQIGTALAFAETVWLVSIDSRKLRGEADKPQSIEDGKSFYRIISLLMSLALLGVFGSMVMAEGGLSFLAIQKSEQLKAGLDRIPRWFFDLAVPWSAGATLLPVMPGVLIFLAFGICRAPRKLFRAGGDAALAVASYSIAALAWLVPITVVELGVFHFNSMDLEKISLPLIPLMVAAPAIILVAAITRIVQWSRRSNNHSIAAALLNIPYLLLLWLLLIIVWVGIVPWVIGFGWIVIDSFL
jgi:hypothetical protein